MLRSVGQRFDIDFVGDPTHFQAPGDMARHQPSRAFSYFTPLTQFLQLSI